MPNPFGDRWPAPRRYRDGVTVGVRPVLALLAVSLAVAAVATAGARAATTLSLRGVEVAASATKGRFAGEARGSGTKATWQAVVEHEVLRRGPSAITGGSFRLAKATGRSVGLTKGTFTGGTIALVSQAAGCGRQVYAVNGRLRTSRGAGALRVRLTHVRRRVLGRCVAYAAYVSGTVTLP